MNPNLEIEMSNAPEGPSRAHFNRSVQPAAAGSRQEAIESALAALGFRMEPSLSSLDEQGDAIMVIGTGEMADDEQLTPEVLAMAEEWTGLTTPPTPTATAAQFEIRVAGHRLLRGDEVTISVMLGNLDGLNFKAPHVEQTHGQWLAYMAETTGIELEVGLPFLELNEQGAVIYQGLIGLGPQLQGRSAHPAFTDTLLASDVAERLARGERGDDLPVLMEAFGCDYGDACDQLFGGRHVDALVALANAALPNSDVIWGAGLRDRDIRPVHYVVKDEHTLGYMQDGSNRMDVLAGSVIKGGHNWKNGSVSILGSRIRRATAADFEAYRVQPPAGWIDGHVDADADAVPASEVPRY